MLRKKYLSLREIEELMNESSDEEETATQIKNADHVDFVLLPPVTVDDVSDGEAIDENVQLLNDQNNTLPNDVAGEIEVLCEFDDENHHKPVEPCKSKPPKKKPRKESASKDDGVFKEKAPNWSKSSKYKYSKQPVDMSVEKNTELYNKLGMFFPRG